MELQISRGVFHGHIEVPSGPITEAASLRLFYVPVVDLELALGTALKFQWLHHTALLFRPGIGIAVGIGNVGELVVDGCSAVTLLVPQKGPGLALTFDNIVADHNRLEVASGIKPK